MKIKNCKLKILHFPHDPQRGQAVMTVVIFLLLISMTGFIGFSFMALTESKISHEVSISEKSYFLSEAGLEDVTYRILEGMLVQTPESLSIDNSTTTVTVTNAGAAREIVSSSSISQYIRKTKIVLTAGAGTNFAYGVQTGQGGFHMENNSILNGNVYSGGDIWGTNDPIITGDAYAAGTFRIFDFPNIQGNAYAHNIRNSGISKNATSSQSIVSSTVGAHAYAEKIGDSDIDGNAYYTTLIGSSTVLGTLNPGYLQPLDLPTVPFPIPDSQIEDWKIAAAAGGVHTSPCPYILSSGTTTLGPLKINCDFRIENDAGVVMNGPLWVVGNLDIKNDANLTVNTSYESQSESVVVDNPSNRTTSSKIVVQNNAKVYGAGAGSYITLISMNNSSELGGSEVAISPKNNTVGSIYYAPYGEILIENNIQLKEATAYLIHAINNAVVTYETGLNNVQFSTGPQGGYAIGRWHEIQ